MQSRTRTSRFLILDLASWTKICTPYLDAVPRLLLMLTKEKYTSVSKRWTSLRTRKWKISLPRTLYIALSRVSKLPIESDHSNLYPSMAILSVSISHQMSQKTYSGTTVWKTLSAFAAWCCFICSSQARSFTSPPASLPASNGNSTTRIQRKFRS